MQNEPEYQSFHLLTGDLSQIDLPKKYQSGLNKSIHFIKKVEGVQTVNLDNTDVIRHPLVQEILRKYEEHENRKHKLRK